MKKFFQAMSHPVSSNLSFSDSVNSSGTSFSDSVNSSGSESDSYQVSESSVVDSDDSDS